MNQLHESDGGVDLSANTCLYKLRIYRDSTVFIGITITLIVVRVFCEVQTSTSFLKCKGMREYARRPSYFPLARKVMAVLACGTL